MSSKIFTNKRTALMTIDDAPPSDVTQPTSPRRRWIYLLTGLLLGGFFLFLTARNIDLDEAVAIMYTMDRLWLLPLTIIFILNLFLRSVRWRLIFPDNNRPTLRHAFDALLIGKVGNNFMPGRLGELLRTTIIGRHLPGVGVSGSLATIILEKILDILAVLIMLGIALLTAPLPPWIASAGLGGLAIFLGLLLFLWMINKAGKKISFATELDASASHMDKAKQLAVKTLQKFTTGLQTLGHARHFTVLSGLTLLIWFWEVIVIFILLQAFSISAPFLAALVCMVFLCAGSMLPAAPGFIGTYQLFIVAALRLFSVPDTEAFALAMFLNIYVIIMTTIIGLLAFLLEGGLINVRQAANPITKAE